MSELLSMLVPLHTLAGWPAAANPSPLHVIGLLIGVPAVIYVVIYLLVKASAIRRARREPAAGVTEPVWLTSEQQASSAAGATATRARAGRTAETGGASARW